MGILTVASSAIQWLMLIQPEIHAWRNKDKLHTRCQMGFASVVQRERVAEPCLYKYYSNYSLSLFPVAKGFCLVMFQVCDCMPCLAVEKVPFWLCQEHGTICCAAPRHSSMLLRHKSAQSRPSGDPALVRRRSISWAVQKISKNMGLLYIPPVPQKALIQKRHQSHEL